MFREESGAAVHIAACATVRAAGLKCFHHFPEFFSVLDAMWVHVFRRVETCALLLGLGAVGVGHGRGSIGHVGRA